MGENKQSEEYPISFSEGPCIATCGLVITTKLRDKVDIGRRLSGKFSFWHSGTPEKSQVEFFFRDYFPQMYNFQASSEARRTRQKITSICYQVIKIKLRNFPMTNWSSLINATNYVVNVTISFVHLLERSLCWHSHL